MKVVDGLSRAPTTEEIQFIQDILRVNFPESLLSCVSQCDEGMPENDIFAYKNPSTDSSIRETTGSFMSFIPSNENNIVRFFFSKPPFFPNSLIPVMATGGGDYICFDYSISGFEDKEPPVVLWIHDNPEGKEIVDLAINFKKFLEKLEPSEGIAKFEK